MDAEAPEAEDHQQAALSCRPGRGLRRMLTARKRLEAETPAFVPAIVAAAESAAAREPEPRPKRRVPRRSAAAIELEAWGVTVRIGEGASPATIAAMIAALKGER